MLNLDPQNPYDSFMVEASAGTGKTYQLTQRFLFLVGAGADPSQILAITFTVKAVGEMHARIIAEASDLLVNKEYQKKFEKKLKAFYKDFMKSKPGDYVFSSPRTAEETARLILTSTQRLKISTIDSIFYEWVMRFPTESASNKENKIAHLRSLNLVESYEGEKINQRAWDAVFKKPEQALLFSEAFKKINEVLPQKGFLGIQKQIEELYRYRLHIFYVQKKEKKAFLAYRLNLAEKLYEKSFEDMIRSLKNELTQIAKKTTKEALFVEAIEKADLECLMKHRLLTKKGQVSKSLIRGKKREELSSPISLVDEALSSFFHEKSKHNLNIIGENLFLIYKIWCDERDLVKKNLMVCEFPDLSARCHNLFSKEENSSVLWLLQKSLHHVLIDEFQDTSMVQWDVFSNLLSEIMSSFESTSDEKSHKTSFVVGDRKQSIYGFREADPYVMTLSSEFYEHYAKGIVSLNKSYRAAPLVMDFLSGFFLDKIDKNFPVHETALDDKGQSVIPNVSKVLVYKEFERKEGDLKSPMEKEAENLAVFLEDVFSKPEKYPIFDKEKKVFRKIRYRDICVLYRNATHVETFTKALEGKNIPFKREGDQDFFENPEIEAVLCLLKFFVDPEDFLSLLTFLRSDFLLIPENLVLSVLEKTKDFSSQERLLKIFELFEEEGFSLDFILSIRKESYRLLPHKTLLLILKRFSSAEASEGEELKKQRLSSEKLFMGLLELLLELEKKGFLSLHGCLEEIEKISSSLLQGSQEGSEDSVSFMTIHKSKGLEFSFVALIEASDSWFKYDRYWIKSKDGLYYSGTYEAMPREDFAFQSVYKEAGALMYEETIRLLYVALTRASQYLLVTAHKSSSGSGEGSFHRKLIDYFENNLPQKKEEGGCYFLEPSEEKNLLFEEKESLASVENKNAIFSVSSEASDIKILNPHESISYEKNELKEKGKKNERLSSLVGTFVHKAFEIKINKKVFSLERLWEKLVLSTPVFSSARISEKQAKKLFLETKREIEKTFSSSLFQGFFSGALEVIPEFSVISLDSSYLIKGSLDIFIRYEKEILILDYKTSEVSSSENYKDFCQSHGYHKQIFMYKKILSKIYPSYKIRGGVWLTKVREFVDL